MDIGIHFTYASRDYSSDYEDLIRRVKRAGFDILELSPAVLTDMPESRRQSIKELAADMDLRLTACLGIPPHLDPASVDERIRYEGVRYLIKILETVAGMGIDLIIGSLHACWPYPLAGTLPDRDRVEAQSVRSMTESNGNKSRG